ncbi:hypothetical protein D3C80_801240 [compost metagenome]
MLYHCEGRFAFGLALGDEAVGGIDGNFCAAKLRLRLTLAGFQLGGIHLGQNLTRLDEVAFANHQLLQPAGGLGGDVDFHRFDAAVAGGKTRG